MFRNFCWVWEGVVDSDFCDYVLSKSDWETAQTGKVRQGEGKIDPEQRITDIVWHDIHAPITALAYQYIIIANELAGWNFDLKYPQKAQVGKYKEGSHYDWHIDSFTPNETGLQRKLSCSILLNDSSEYEGGKLEIANVDTPLPGKKGSVIVFPSLVKHRVTPVTLGERFSAVCWALGPEFK
jgi:PKHD-type hydroxylase